MARAFVRPSGTEDILRLYVEAPQPSDMNKLTKDILATIDYAYADYVSEKIEPVIESEESASEFDFASK
jgi:phosphoglucomutase